MKLGINLGISSSKPQSTVITQAVAILRRFGTNAHVYLPGIGTLSGLQTANYLDSVGTTAATVDSPVGLVLDAAGSVGVELVTNGTFDSASGWSTGTNTVISGGVATTSGATAFAQVVSQSIAVTQGKTYLFSVTASKVSGNSLALGLGAQNIILGMNGSATYSSYVSVTGASGALLLNVFEGNGATWVGSIDNISVREVTGIAATQPTTAAKPILRQTAGKYSWAFDGGDSLALGSVPFQMSDDHAVIAGASTSSTATQQGILCLANSGTTNPVITLQLDATGRVQGFWRDDAGNNVTRGSAAVVSGSFVASVRKTGGGTPTVSACLNGTRTAELSASTVGATTLNTATVGAWVRTSTQFYLTGSTGPILAIKGTLTDSEMLTLERFASSLTPNGPTF